MKSWKTRLVQSDVTIPPGFRSLMGPVYRGSTTLFADAAAVSDDWHPGKYAYGLYGTPTTLELANRIAELEEGTHTLLTPGGQAAIALVYLSFLAAGDHVLIPDSAYGPNRDFASDLISRFSVHSDFYPPLIGAAIGEWIRPETRLIWCESPGSNTMEVQDVRAIAAVAHRHGITVAVDNTYAAGVLFDALAAGADVTMQALTKYVGGHSDLLLGSVTTRSVALHEKLGATHRLLGYSVSPDDCALALRGLQTLAVRLEALERSTLLVADWLSKRPEVERVLHPAFACCPGHEIYRRDFKGSASVFSILLRSSTGAGHTQQFVNALKLFRIGYSWGGVHSLAIPCTKLRRNHGDTGDRLVRLNVGLEDVADLIADLEQAFAKWGDQ